MVNKVMTPYYEKGFTPEDVVAMGIEGVLDRIKQIGLAPTKSKNVFNLSKILLEKYDGDIPNNREDLENLPGVGRKTANVILGEIFGEPTLAVDTHVFRVTHRLGLQNEKNPLKAELTLMTLIDLNYLPKLHHLFIMLGRYTCKAIKPQCNLCKVQNICPSKLE